MGLLLHGVKLTLTLISLENDLTCLCFGGGFFSSNFLSPYFLYVKGTPYLAAGFVIFWAGTREMALCPDAGLLPAWKDKQFFFSSSLQWTFNTKKKKKLQEWYFRIFTIIDNNDLLSNIKHQSFKYFTLKVFFKRLSHRCSALARALTHERVYCDVELVWVQCFVTVEGNPN